MTRRKPRIKRHPGSTEYLKVSKLQLMYQDMPERIMLTELFNPVLKGEVEGVAGVTTLGLPPDFY